MLAWGTLIDGFLVQPEVLSPRPPRNEETPSRYARDQMNEALKDHQINEDSLW